MCLPTVTRELALGTVGATVATTRAAGGGPEGELHGGEHHRGAGQDGAQVRQPALTRPGCCAGGDAHHGSETADRHYEQENRHL